MQIPLPLLFSTQTTLYLSNQSVLHSYLPLTSAIPCHVCQPVSRLRPDPCRGRLPSRFGHLFGGNCRCSCRPLPQPAHGKRPVTARGDDPLTRTRRGYRSVRWQVQRRAVRIWSWVAAASYLVWLRGQVVNRSDWLVSQLPPSSGWPISSLCLRWSYQRHNSFSNACNTVATCCNRRRDFHYWVHPRCRRSVPVCDLHRPGISTASLVCRLCLGLH